MTRIIFFNRALKDLRGRSRQAAYALALWFTFRLVRPVGKTLMYPL
jgi:hypothetical protein